MSDHHVSSSILVQQVRKEYENIKDRQVYAIPVQATEGDVVELSLRTQHTTTHLVIVHSMLRPDTRYASDTSVIEHR